MLYGQLVIGLPGSGKSTYCHSIQQIYTQLHRNLILVNLDPGNDNIRYNCHVDICQLVQLSDIQQTYNLGPNGSLLYAIEFIEANLQWLITQIKQCITKHSKDERYKNKHGYTAPPYIIIDMPGQIELYTHHRTLYNIIHNTIWTQLSEGGVNWTCIHLCDSIYISDINKYISMTLLSLNAMISMELPHINVLTKIDLLLRNSDSTLLHELQNYVDVIDIRHLIQSQTTHNRYSKLTDAICELIEDYSLVSYLTLDITNMKSILNIVKYIDKANGYVWLDEYDTTDQNQTYRILNSIHTTNNELSNIDTLREQYSHDIEECNEIDSDDELWKHEQYAQAQAAAKAAIDEYAAGKPKT